ncbi:hypothetical protein B0H34DRAFT_62960 [Crassisporium funariophilum]|nr:hypothetical protein B0H34DRAFT_62960 [Crassisporium funariophilum]
MAFGLVVTLYHLRNLAVTSISLTASTSPLSLSPTPLDSPAYLFSLFRKPAAMCQIVSIHIHTHCPFPLPLPPPQLYCVFSTFSCPQGNASQMIPLRLWRFRTLLCGNSPRQNNRPNLHYIIT